MCGVEKDDTQTVRGNSKPGRVSAQMQLLLGGGSTLEELSGARNPGDLDMNPSATSSA